MHSPVKKLPLKLEEAVLVLLETGDLAQTATQCKISMSTLQRWRRREEFQSVYINARQELVERGVSTIASLTADAVRSLKETLDNPWAKPSTKVRAAKVILDVSLKLLGVPDDDDGEDTMVPPEPAPVFDLSKLSPDEWTQFKMLRQKCKVSNA